MKVVFLSNYINHHQLPVSMVFYNKFGSDYSFIETEPIEAERLNMGWKEENNLPFLVKAYRDEENRRSALQKINEADIVICGHVLVEDWILERLKANKITFFYAERIYKRGQWRVLSPKGYKIIKKQYCQFEKYPFYILAASAYLPCDLDLFHIYRDRIYKWGYFPEFINCDCYKKPERKTINILWAGRMIDWKRPEHAIAVAEHLKKKNIDFRLRIIGNGDQYEAILSEVILKDLEKYVEFLGSQTPDKVRACMLEADIYLATSNYQEGWGAVINEAMNSRCAIIASHAMGAVPYLIKNKDNGLIYNSSSVASLLECVDYLIEDTDRIPVLGEAAYQSIKNKWNAEKAVDNLMKLYESIIFQNEADITGPCEKAPHIREKRMWKYVNI